MSSLKSVALFPLLADVSFADLRRAASQLHRFGSTMGPSPVDVAHAVRFSAQSQPFAANCDNDERSVPEVADPRMAA